MLRKNKKLSNDDFTGFCKVIKIYLALPVWRVKFYLFCGI